MGEVLTMHVATGEKVVDLAMKVVMNGPKWDCLVGKYLMIYVIE